MPHIFDAKKLKKLESPKRYEAIKPAEILKDMALKVGDVMLDFGVGTGFFSMSALEIIGKGGHLYGTDISEEMLEFTKERVSDLKNVSLIKSDGNEIPIDNSSIDFVLMAFVLHELENKDEVLSEIKRILKPGGILGIIEWDTENLENGPPLLDRISIETASELLKAGGFALKNIKAVSGRFYCIKSIKE